LLKKATSKEYCREKIVNADIAVENSVRRGLG